MAEPPAPVMRWPLAAGLVTVLLLGILVGGVFLARRLQTSDASQVVISSAPTSTLAPAATLVRPVVAAPVAASTRQSVETVITPEITQVVQIAVGTASGTPRVVFLTPGATPTPVQWWEQTGAVAAPLANELQTAYLHFWQVRTQALQDLNTAPLGQVMDGPALSREINAINDLRARNQAQQLDVQHQIQVMHATNEDATIFDQYTSRTLPLDLATHQPLTPEPAATWRLAYHFQKLSGTWKVVEAVQLDS